MKFSKIIFFLSMLFCSVLINAQGTQDWANFGRYTEANKTLKQPIKVVFMGNSITEGWVSTDPDFFTNNNYVGRGISGQVSSQMLVRFQSDVISLKPKAAVILAGVNDIALNNGYISVEHIFENIVSMAELAKQHKIKVVLCSVLPAHHFPWRAEVESINQIKELNEKIKNYAYENKIAYADYYTAMVDDRQGLNSKYQRDEVHPNLQGYKIMELVIQKILSKIF
ncbi:MAG: GDSL-type esterase/lipase family protein [Bacteroidota bacterium]|nr:GDSL-type esterase/lipase family protein [Bacteroidota bacterium]